MCADGQVSFPGQDRFVVSMLLSACGQEKTNLATLLLEDAFGENGDPCDSY